MRGAPIESAGITADGVDYLEKHYETNLQRKRLRDAPIAPVESESSHV